MSWRLDNWSKFVFSCHCSWHSEERRPSVWVHLRSPRRSVCMNLHCVYVWMYESTLCVCMNVWIYIVCINQGVLCVWIYIVCMYECMNLHRVYKPRRFVCMNLHCVCMNVWIYIVCINQGFFVCMNRWLILIWFTCILSSCRPNPKHENGQLWLQIWCCTPMVGSALCLYMVHVSCPVVLHTHGWVSTLSVYCTCVMPCGAAHPWLGQHSVCIRYMCHALWCCTPMVGSALCLFTVHVSCPVVLHTHGWVSTLSVYCTCVMPCGAAHPWLGQHSVCILYMCHALWCSTPMVGSALCLYTVHVSCPVVLHTHGWVSTLSVYGTCVMPCGAAHPWLGQHSVCILYMCHALWCCTPMVGSALCLYTVHVSCPVVLHTHGWVSTLSVYCTCVMPCGAAHPWLGQHSVCILYMWHALWCCTPMVGSALCLYTVHVSCPVVLHTHGWVSTLSVYCTCVMPCGAAHPWLGQHSVCIRYMCHALWCSTPMVGSALCLYTVHVSCPVVLHTHGWVSTLSVYGTCVMPCGAAHPWLGQHSVCIRYMCHALWCSTPMVGSALCLYTVHVSCPVVLHTHGWVSTLSVYGTCVMCTCVMPCASIFAHQGFYDNVYEASARCDMITCILSSRCPLNIE